MIHTDIDRYIDTYHYSVHGGRCHDQCGARLGSPQLKQNTKFTLSVVKDLTYEKFKKVSPKKLKNIEHVRCKMEDYCWEEDNLQEEYIEQSIVHLEKIQMSHQMKKTKAVTRIAV